MLLHPNQEHNKAQQTVALFKPDVWKRGLGGVLLMEVEHLPLRISWLHGRLWSLDLARRFYGRQHEGKPYFEDLTRFMAGGFVMEMVLEGADSILRWRNFVTITRKRFLAEGYIGPSNLLHGSDSKDSFEHEIKALVGPVE